MTVGLLAASGYDRSDSDYTVKIYDTGWFTLLGAPDGSSATFSSQLTINNTEASAASDSRHVLFATALYDPTNSTQTITGLDINGESADNFATNQVTFNAGTKRLCACVGSQLLASGNTIPFSITCSQTLPSGAYFVFYAGIFDCGTSGLNATTGSDIAADSSQILDVGDIGNHSGALFVHAFEDTTDDSTSVTISTSTGRTVTAETTSQPTAGVIMGGGIINGSPSNDFALSAQPNNDETNDEGILMYITANY